MVESKTIYAGHVERPIEEVAEVAGGSRWVDAAVDLQGAERVSEVVGSR